MSVISTNAFGDIDLQGYGYSWRLGGGTAPFAYTFYTDKGNYTFVPDDFIAKGVVANNKQYYSTKFLDKTFLGDMYTKQQAIEFGEFKGFASSDQFYDALKAQGFATSGVLMPEKWFSDNVGSYKYYDVGRQVGNVSTGAIKGIGEKDGQLVYIPEASGADQATAWLQSDGNIYTQYQPKLNWFQRLGKEIAKIPLFPEIAAIAVAAIPGGQAYAPYVYAALKGAALGAQGVDPLKAGLMVGVNLMAQNLAGNSVVSKNIGATFGIESEALQIATGKAIIGATVNGVRAAVAGQDVTKAMLEGAVTAGASSMVPELTKNVLGGEAKTFIDKVAKETNLTTPQIQTIIATSFVSGIASEIKGGDFTKTFTDSLVSSGVSQSVANEVGKQVSNTVSPEMREAIVTGTSTVARTATKAALDGKDIAKEIEANLPATIVATMSAYTERKENEKTAVKEGWGNYEAKVLAQAKYGKDITPQKFGENEQFISDAKEFTYDASGASSIDEAKRLAAASGYNTFYGPDKKIYTIGGQSLSSMDTFVQAMAPGFNPTEYKLVNGLPASVDAADHYLEIGQYKNFPINAATYVEKQFKQLPEYDRGFYDDEYNMAVRAAQAGDFKKVDDIGKFIDQSYTTADEAREYVIQANKAVGITREPTQRELDMIRGQNEINAYTIAQHVSAVGATTFDGSQAANAKQAGEAAKAAGYNTFVAPDGNTYKVMSTIDEANVRANIEDQKSFKDAFAMARAQLGEGKTFNWGGKSYTTNILPSDTFDASRSSDIGVAATLAYANGKTRFIGPDGKTYNIPDSAKSILENATNQSAAETQRLLRQAVTPEQNEYKAETQRLMESGTRGTMDNVSAMTAQALGTSARGIASLLTNAGKTYAAITGDLSFDNAATKLGAELETYAKGKDVYGIDVQKDRINQALSQANETSNWWDKAKIIGSAISKNPIGFFDVAGSELVEELPETAVQIAIALGTGGTSLAAQGGIFAISAAGAFVESFGNGVESARNQALKQGDSEAVANQKGYLNGVFASIIEAGTEIIADKALLAPFIGNAEKTLAKAFGTFAGSAAIGAGSELVAGFSQNLTEQYIVNPNNVNVSSAATAGIYEMFIGGAVQTGMSIPGLAMNLNTIVGKDYRGNDVSITDLIEHRRTLDPSTINTDIVVGTTQNNNVVTLGGMMTLMPKYDFNNEILTTYAPKVFANPNLLVGRDVLGNNVTVADIQAKVTPETNYLKAAESIVATTPDQKKEAQKVYLRDYFDSIKYNPTDAQISTLLVNDPQGNESLNRTAKTYAYNKIASEENYNLGKIELNRLLSSTSPITNAEEFRNYTDPLSTTRDEAIDFFKSYGYTKPTEEQIQELMIDPITGRSIPTEEDSNIALKMAVGRIPFDPKYDWNGDGRVTAADALNLLKASRGREVQPPAEGNFFAKPIPGMRGEVSARGRAEIISDPYFFDIGEIKAAAAAEGYTLSDEDAKALAREIDESSATAAYRAEIDPLATLDVEAQEFFNTFGYTPEPDELAQFIASRPEAEIRTEIGQYVDPRQMTQQEAESIFGREEYILKPDEITPFVRQGKDIQQAQVEQDILKYIDEQTIKVPELLEYYRSLGIDVPAPQDVVPYIGQMPEAETFASLQEKADALKLNALQNKMLQDEAARVRQRTMQAGLAGLKLPGPVEEDIASGIPQFVTSKTKQQGFESPLESFLKEAKTADFTESPFSGPSVESPPEVAENMQPGGIMPSYFTYGEQTDMDRLFSSPTGLAADLNPFTGVASNFAPFQPMMAARGGLATPLMAGGGLPVVHHSGKMRMDFRQGDAVTGPGDGQSDDIPAMLADGEFVIPADVVAALGNGSTKAGSKKLYDMMHSIRSHHRSSKPKDLPPPAKTSPLDYLKARR